MRKSLDLLLVDVEAEIVNWTVGAPEEMADEVEKADLIVDVLDRVGGMEVEEIESFLAFLEYGDDEEYEAYRDREAEAFEDYGTALERSLGHIPEGEEAVF